MNKLHRSRGVSLIEALVALAVMAFGLLGVVGMQATLRYNSDVSKQRSEAVRMAQEQVEAMRAFNTLADPADHNFADINSVATADVVVPTGFANTTFKITTNVVDPAADGPQFKTLSVDVAWSDRYNTGTSPNQGVQLTTTVAGVAPELAATLGLRGDRAAPQRPGGRHPTIPVTATPIGFDPGRSLFSPPGTSTRHWIFNNATGLVEKVCTVVPTDTTYAGCADVLGLLLSGYINFSVLGTSPSALPPSDSVPIGHIPSVEVTATTSPTPPSAPECYANVALVPVPYFCLVPTKTLSPRTWSGRSNLKLLDSTAADRIPSVYKVCRYTPPPGPSPATFDDPVPGNNAAHPLNYVDVTTSLTNQNFLVILAAASCPSDSVAPYLGNTYLHQPRT
ncbi:MAG: prepilin-type N-terminal cleavage/methylation domain-containing protein [Rubrivivax sp.]|nr:prepilin-type N-terminal cleavage/methylation domain-containing protein [Rubrivivax sp.]MDP3223287.1 prepilin-type N-terminal cleavage/methylation domain-containing protein [Rubrivivax sp.]